MKWAGSRDKIFSVSGRGRTFFLTSLFIELIEKLSSQGIQRALFEDVPGLAFQAGYGSDLDLIDSERHFQRFHSSIRNALIIKNLAPRVY